METATKQIAVPRPATKREQLKEISEYIEVAKELAHRFIDIDNHDSSRVVWPIFEASKMLRAACLFPIIDIHFLEMRNAKLLPKFAIGQYSPGNDRVQDSRWWPTRGHFRDIPNLNLRDNARDFEIANQLRSASREPYFTAHGPAVPAPIQAISMNARDIFGHDMYVAWEADWIQGPVTIGPDPLLLGRAGEVFFLIDKWDLTKAEAYVASEFTS